MAVGSISVPLSWPVVGMVYKPAGGVFENTGALALAGSRNLDTNN